MKIKIPLLCTAHLLRVGHPALQLAIHYGIASVSVGPAVAATATPDEAHQAARLAVPHALASAPFDVPHTLNIPKGFSIRVFARIADARFMAVAPNGDLLVSTPGHGSISLLRPNPQGVAQKFTFAAQLRHPHDIVFHTLDDKP